jgi:hypothetical protein
LQEAFPGHIGYAAAKGIFWRERKRVNDKVERPPVLGDALEHRLHLSWLGHVQRHEDLGFELVGERFDKFAGLVVEVSDGKFGAQAAEGGGATPGDGMLVRDADDQPPLALIKSGMEVWDLSREVRCHFKALSASSC